VLPVTAAHELSVTFRLVPQPVQVGYAREQVRKALPGWRLAEYDDLLQLIVSELVTNALPHCDGPIEVCLSYDGTDLWIEVWDNGREMPVRQDPDDDDENGRGLQLVDGLITTYGGVRGTAEHGSGAGKTVFVALSLRPRPPRRWPTTDKPRRMPPAAGSGLPACDWDRPLCLVGKC
jgi:serine/threonine-protein kinase RsbW